MKKIASISGLIVVLSTLFVISGCGEKYSFSADARQEICSGIIKFGMISAKAMYMGHIMGSTSAAIDTCSEKLTESVTAGCSEADAITMSKLLGRATTLSDVVPAMADGTIPKDCLKILERLK